MAAKEATATQEPKYSLASLGKSAKVLFSVSPATFAGATAALDPNAEYTVAEIRERIKDWMTKEAR